MANASTELPVALTIAGSDSGGGAGVQADLLTFAAHGVFGTTALTCLTAQNPDGVSGIAAMEASFVLEQIQQVHRFFRIDALKTGMLFSEPIIQAVAGFLRANPSLPAVVDPVMVATSGAVLLQPEAVQAIQSFLLPRAALVTPNLDEAQVLLGRKPSGADEMAEAGRELARRFGTAFLIKGGHLQGDEVVDVLASPDGATHAFRHPRLSGVNTHGSGCTLSAAIAANLAKGAPLPDAVAQACRYLHQALTQSLSTRGTRYISHFPGRAD